MPNEVEELFKEDVVESLTFEQILALHRGEEGQEIYKPLIFAGRISGTEYESASSGARVRILPEDDLNIGLQIIDNANADVFKAIVGGADVGDVIMGDYSNNKYAMWDKSVPEFIIKGVSLTNPIITGIQAGTEIAIQGWSHNMVFSATDHDTIAWASGSIKLLDGTIFSIDAGDTGTMSSITYIYFSKATSETVLQTTTTYSTALGPNKILVAVAQNVASGNKATFQVLGGKALGGIGKLITASDIVANTITANEIGANVITAAEIYAGTITATEISTGLYTEIDANLPSDENLVGYWAFDEGAGDKAYDGSGNSHTGTLTNMEEADWVDGVAGSCLDFDGSNEYMRCTDTDIVANAVTNCSVSLWIKIDTQPAANTEKQALAFITSPNGSDGFGCLIRYKDVSGVKYLSCLFGGSGSSWATNELTLTNGVFYHIIVVKAGSTITVYKDGVVLSNTGTVGSAQDWTTTSTGLTVGAARDAATFWDGKIDEVRIYDTNLIAKEAYALYKNPSGQPSLAVPIGRLTTGSIYSKQITLAVAAGTGDSYIAGGLGLDLDNWRGGNATGGAFILGLDDSVANDPAKFFIGNYSTNEYMKFDTDLQTTGLKVLESFTAGEDITTGNAVCIKPAVEDVAPSNDAQVVEQSGDTNCGSNNTMRVKIATNDDYESFIKFSLAGLPSAEQILKAVLRIYVYNKSATAQGIKVDYVSGADWTEGTITWNNKPATTAIVNYSEGSGAKTTPGAPNVMEFDITQLVRKWKNADINNYGLRIYGNTNNLWTDFYCKDYSGQETYHPELRVHKANSSDGKVYKANQDDYETCRIIAGISKETKSADEVVKIQTVGKNTDITISIGEMGYIGTTGGSIINSTLNFTRIVKIGMATMANTLFIQQDYANMLIEGNMVPIVGFTSGMELIAPDDARYCIIDAYYSTNNEYHHLTVYRCGADNITSGDTDSTYIKAVWSAKKITLTGGNIDYFEYHFYR